jgi:signal transduction histidine kinase
MDLRPSMLDDLGIVATLEWFCREYQETWPEIELCKVVNIKEADLDDALKVVIFRIMQEALNNISKHARATQVKIALKQRDGKLRLRIRDNGRGFDTENAYRLNTGLGLMSMRERAEVSGAVFDIRSNPDKGTLIEVLWAPS